MRGGELTGVDGREPRDSGDPLSGRQALVACDAPRGRLVQRTLRSGDAAPRRRRREARSGPCREFARRATGATRSTGATSGPKRIAAAPQRESNAQQQHGHDRRAVRHTSSGSELTSASDMNTT